IHELDRIGLFGGIRMSDFSRVCDYDLKNAWLEVSEEVKNLQTLHERYPERPDLPIRLQSRISLQELYREELNKRGV
ncbi:MAG: hypothetical protein K8E24_003045, partial [Methanobacterium paludis]|nr:hypothetical protein [Methanobacterium paludis]